MQPNFPKSLRNTDRSLEEENAGTLAKRRLILLNTNDLKFIILWVPDQLVITENLNSPNYGVGFKNQIRFTKAILQDLRSSMASCIRGASPRKPVQQNPSSE